MNQETLNLLLSALTRAEHKTTGALTPEEYWAVVELAQEVNAPQFITEYWANKAITSGNDDTYDEFGVNTRNSFNTAPKGE